MNSYIALLRGINVSGQKKIKMADLREAMKKLPFEDVETYIQSGNIVFKSKESKIAKIENAIETMIEKTFSFEVPVLVKLAGNFEQIVHDCPYTNPLDLAEKKIYYALLKNAASPNAILNLKQEDYPSELFKISTSCVYLNCTKGAGKAKLTNNLIEKKLNVSATTRNHLNMIKLIENSNA